MPITVNVKKFDSSAISKAKRIVDDVVIKRELLESSLNQVALPSQFVYTFCGLLVDDEEELRDVNSKQDVNAVFDQYHIAFSSIEHPDYDQHLSPLFNQLLPFHASEVMELVFEFNMPKPMSVKDFVELMAQQGFVYNQNSVFLRGYYPDECFFKDLMKEFVFV